MPLKAWNAELVQALGAKASEQEAKNSARWHLWQRAAEAVEKVKKDIKITQTGSVQNLPKESSEFCKTAKDYCEQIMRSGHIPQLASPAVPTNHNGEHPYLRGMTHRGGGYAILRVLWDAEKPGGSYKGYLTKDEICRSGQKYCDDPMRDNHWENRHHNHGWESNKSLLNYKLIERDKAGKCWASNFRGPKDRISLTQAGRDFVPLMLQKFGDADDGQPEAPAPVVNRVVKGTKKSLEDKDALDSWVATAPIGATKEFQVSNERRKYLHNYVEQLNTQASGHRLLHDSRGAGKQRVLVLKKVQQNAPSGIGAPMDDLGFTLPSFSAASSCAAGPSCEAPSSGPGHKLGGRQSSQSSHGKREAAAMAAEQRMCAASARDMKRPRTKPRATTTTRNPPVEGWKSTPSSLSSSSGSDSEMDDDMRKAMEASLQEAPKGHEDEDPDLKEALRLSLEPSSQSQGTPSPARFAKLSAASSTVPIELDDSQPRDDLPHELVLLVDDHERHTDKSPRDILEELQRKLEGVAGVSHQRLKMGDYMWTSSGQAVGVCIERKTLRDLVGRSARGDHLRQLRRLSASALPAALLIEGDIATADHQVAYGADPISRGHGDPAIRESLDVLCLLARLVLQKRCFVLLTANAVDTATYLTSMSLVIQTVLGDCPSTTFGHSAADRSDSEWNDLLVVLDAAGLASQHRDTVAGRFNSLDELQVAYEKCPDILKRQLLLAPLLQLSMDEGSQGGAAATSMAAALLSWQVFGAVSGAHGDCPTASPSAQLFLMATKGISKDIHSMPTGNMVEECKPCCKDVEEVRVQLRGTGEFSSFKSATAHIYLLTGSHVLRFFSRALQEVGTEDLAAAAITASKAITKALPLERRGPGQTLLLFEGVETAARQACSKGQNEPSFQAAKQCSRLLPATIAVLMLRHHVRVLPWRNRAKVTEFLLAFFKEFSETQLLDQ